MTPVALAQKRGGTEKIGYLLAFTNVLDITQVRTSKTYFLKRASVYPSWLFLNNCKNSHEC